MLIKLGPFVAFMENVSDGSDEVRGLGLVREIPAWTSDAFRDMILVG